MQVLRLVCLTLWLAGSSGYAASVEASLELQEKKKELVDMLEKILTQHLEISGYELKEVDSDTSLVVQVFYPKTHTPHLLGQSGVFLRSLKILFNEMYLYAQEFSAQKQGQPFSLQKAKKMHLRFVEKD